jgi:hypothetical protein
MNLASFPSSRTDTIHEFSTMFLQEHLAGFARKPRISKTCKSRYEIMGGPREAGWCRLFLWEHFPSNAKVTPAPR